MMREKISSDMTYYKFSIITWNATNVPDENKWIPDNLKQPDYTKLNK